jgi:tRNA(His) 5'-end guanylyltransferase
MLEKGLVKMNKSDNLGDRMKRYEALTTSVMLMENLPIYARIDGRAFHSFCRGLDKPFDLEFVKVMQNTCQELVLNTNAILGYVQSDEISLAWLDSTKAPFDGRLFKLESVLASIATSIFVQTIYSNVEYNKNKYIDLIKRCQKHCVSFDCRVFQLPNEEELANCFLWRENDAYRNSVSMLAQAYFSHKELQGKSSAEMQEMYYQKTGKNYNDLESHLKRGTYFQRKLFVEELDEETLAKIPEGKRPADNKVIRSKVVELDLPIMRKVENKVGAYFYNEEPILWREENA